MAEKTGIEWCDATWNPVRGCTRISEGCRNCYAERVAARFSGPGQPYEGLAHRVGGEPRWTGKVAFAGERTLTQPLRWKKPRRIFVNSMSDLFHENVPDEWIDRIFAVMALSPQHTFQVLTKRAERMRARLASFPSPLQSIHYAAAIDPEPWRWISDKRRAITPYNLHLQCPWPLPNVWLGVSVEDQAAADARREDLRALAEQGWLTFVSYEPALGPVDWAGWEFLRWLISGGESGPDARVHHPGWFRLARDFCAARGIAYFHKQNGEWAPGVRCSHPKARTHRFDDGTLMSWFGKKAAGALLDGREHREWPQ